MLAMNSVKDILQRLKDEDDAVPQEIHEAAIHTDAANLEVAKKIIEARTPILRVEVLLHKNAVEFQPNFEIFTAAMDSVIAGFIETATGVPKLISHVIYDITILLIPT
jgi:hypothetical protein